MSSYESLPQEDCDETKEECNNNNDFDFSFIPQRRKFFDLPIYLYVVLMTVTEIIFFQYYKDFETYANVATFSLVFSYVRLVYSGLRFFNDVPSSLAPFQNQKKEKKNSYVLYKEPFWWSAKFITSWILIWWFKISFTIVHLSSFMCLYILSLLYLCVFKRWSWPDICKYSSKNPDLGAPLAHGTYEGFYAHILPKFREKLTPFTAANYVPLKKMIILLPRSCSREKHLIDNDDTELLECCGVFNTISRDSCGARERKYNITKYKVRRRDNKEEFYCFFDVPSSLANLKIIATQHSQDPEYFDEQFKNYVIFLRDCLKNDQGCKNNYKLVPYNDLDADDNYLLPLSRVLELIVDGKMDQINPIHV